MTSAANRILYLSHAEVRAACDEIDPVAAVREALALHAEAQTVLPDEAYLAWRNGRDEAARSLSMPGYLGGSTPVAGAKIINANPSNPDRGLPRATGMTVLFDVTTAESCCILEGAYLSALRTASVTALAVELLNGGRIERLALIGAGALARAHLRLLPRRLSGLRTVALFDLRRDRAEALQRELSELLAASGVVVEVSGDAREAVRGADLVVPVTTTTTGYIAPDWLAPGTLVVHVSLDDVLPEVVLEADVVIVDDWRLVRSDARRLLGRMHREGLIVGPDEPATGGSGRPRRVDAELGEIVVGRRTGRTAAGQVILVNPFGLSIEDLAVARKVYETALRLGRGTWLER